MAQYVVTPDEFKELKNRFTYHAPKGDQQERYVQLRQHGFDLALHISTMVPPGRERALALTNLEQAIFWANAGIARGE